MDLAWALSSPSISQILPGLFLGNERSTYHEPTLENNGITAVVSLMDRRLALWKRPKFTRHIPKDRHLYICCRDSLTQDLLKHMEEISDFIDRMLEGSPETKGNVLVHCVRGASRSGAVVVAYLMRKQNKDLASVLAQVKAKRPRVAPNDNFMTQLEVWDQVRYQIWEDEEKKMPKRPYADFLEKRAVLLKANLG